MSEKPTSTAMKTQPSGMAKYASTYAAHWRRRPLMRLIATADLPERLANPRGILPEWMIPKSGCIPTSPGLELGAVA
jgi:hypothetical protein